MKKNIWCVIYPSKSELHIVQKYMDIAFDCCSAIEILCQICKPISMYWFNQLNKTFYPMMKIILQVFISKRNPL